VFDALVKEIGAVFAVLALAPILAQTTMVASADAREAADSEVTEITQIIRDSIGWALTKDRARLESILAHDEDLFMFEPTWEPRIEGWEDFLPLFDVYMDDRFVATGYDVRDLRLNFSRTGDVAWFSAILDDRGTWEGVEVEWKDTRWTGVLEKRGGVWLIVQMHFSFAADRMGAESGEEKSEEGGRQGPETGEATGAASQSP